MIAPRNRLLFWFGLVVVPCSILAGTHPATLAVCIVLIALLVLVVALDALLSRRVLDGIRLEIPAVSRMGLEKDGHIEVRLRNPTRRPRVVRLALPLPGAWSVLQEELDVTLPGDTEWSRLTWPCRPAQRGNHAVRTAYIEASSPVGFWNTRRSLPVQGEIRVYPDLHREQRALSLMFRGAFGSHAQRQVGKGRDFEKLRDYVPGDSSEDIHWKATARRGHPVTKVFQIERTQEVYVAIDTSRLSAREDAIERHLSAALLLGLAAEHQGDLFGLLSFSDRVESFVRARAGAAHFQACRETISTRHPRPVNPDFDEVGTFIRLRLRRRSLVIFLTALDDPVLSENFVRAIGLVARQHVVVVGMIQPAGVAPVFTTPISGAEEMYDRLGGHLRWQNMEEVGGHLHRLGVKFCPFDNEHLGLRLVSEYLTIKKRQLL